MRPNRSIAMGFVVICAAASLVGVLRWSKLRHTNNVDRTPLITEDSGAESRLNAKGAELFRKEQNRPHPRLSLVISKCSPIGSQKFRMDFRIKNFGVPSPVVRWHVRLAESGHIYEAQVQHTFDHTVLKKSQQGFLIVNLPAFALSKGEVLPGAIWNIGYADSRLAWRWSNYSI